MNEKKGVGLAVASMVLGIISLLLGCCFWYITIPAAIIAVILAAVSMSKKMGGKGMAITGLVTSIISLIPAAIVAISGTSLLALGSMSSVSDESSKADDSSSSSIVEESENEESDSKTGEDTISIASWEISEDYDGKDVVVIEYAWTNNDDEPAEFAFSINDNVYQNGVELEGAIGCKKVDSDASLKKVQSGKTYNVKKAYVLEDMSEINVVATTSFWNDEILNENIDISKSEKTGGETKETKENDKKSDDDKEEEDDISVDDVSFTEVKNAVDNGDYSLVTPEFKETMDSYEAFVDEYVEFMNKYLSGEGNIMDMLDDYTDMLANMEEWTNKIDEIDETKLSSADEAYYLLVTLRIEEKLMKVII